MNAVVTIAALPVTFAVLWALLRSPLGTRLVAEPSSERWHERATPMFGGVGIFAGFVAAVLLALATGFIEWSGELGGILGGIALLFVAGLIDDLRHLSPIAKLAAQIAAAVMVLASGLEVEIVGNEALAWAIGLLWLVGITNAFNLLDNMDGLAATLAAIACGYFAIDAATEHENDTVLVLALSLGIACVAFLPFNLRPGRKAAVFMGDSGSQVLGFGLASLALASSWTVAGTTFATVLLPLLVLAIPILDTTLVTLVRLAQRRPVTQGGKDHTSHRLVYYGLSESKAVLLLAVVATALGATALAYNVLDNARLTAIGVLVTFVLLVQFGSFLSDLEERSRAGAEAPPEPPLWRALVFEPRRLVEVVVDFVLICGSFLAAYYLVIGGRGTEFERSIFLSALPILLATRYSLFVGLGVYRRVWRYATARDVVPIAVACFGSAVIAYLILISLRDIGDFPLEVFVVDAFLSTILVGASRLTLRLVPEARARRHGRRVLIVGAGRAGRGLARELHDGHEVRVVGFLDDNPRVRRRRIHGITVVGALDEAPRAIPGTRADEVLVTIPDAPSERLQLVVKAASEAGVPCRIVKRRTEFTAPETAEAVLP